MKTRQQFIDRWKVHLVGLAVYGAASEVTLGPMARAGRIVDIPADVEKLLGKMWDELDLKPTSPAPLPLNGQPQPQEKR